MAFTPRAKKLGTTKQKQDESIMGTNNSCIVSKRSVEKLYHKKDYGFFRHFVRKFQRRSPLINRGYWLRMKAIENEVVRFLARGNPRRKVVVNLGCGYDSLPFTILDGMADISSEALFVDVDYPELISKKCDIIRSTPSINRLLNPSLEQCASALLRSSQYCAIACDLENVDNLRESLACLFEIDATEVLFVAEVSMIYMDVATADAIIGFAATFPYARFCLLEQFLPDGPEHPFAQTMLKHFRKLQSPLRSVLEYQSLHSQEQRFLQQSWGGVCARTLWDLWGDDSFLKPEERRALDFVEPFDEWEEFALYAGHYFLLVAASKNLCDELSRSKIVKVQDEEYDKIDSMYFTFAANSKSEGLRRFGAIWKESNYRLHHHGGQGIQGRLSDFDTLISDDVFENEKPAKVLHPPAEVMCHTITSFNGAEALLVGGRTSPERASTGCYVWQEGVWARGESLPHGLFRHCAVSIPSSTTMPSRSMVLVFGGKTGQGEAMNDWLLWDSEKGWSWPEVSFQRPCARFGAAMSTYHNASESGILAGGLSQDGRVLEDIWEWEIIRTTENGSRIVCTLRNDELKIESTNIRVGRYGATLLPVAAGLLLIGGIQSATGVVPPDHEVLLIDRAFLVKSIHLIGEVPRPLLTGFSAAKVKGNEILIVGGGAVCFSFGSFWNQGTYLIGTTRHLRSPWSIDQASTRPQLNDSLASSAAASPPHPAPRPSIEATGDQTVMHNDTKRTCSMVPRVPSGAALNLGVLLGNSTPMVIEDANLGRCIELWSFEYLKQRVGAERQVIIHAAGSSRMDFLSKNFSYTSKPFGVFLDEVEKGEKLYLRSVSSTSPSQRPTNLEQDFPTIAKDFQLPAELSDISQNVHSSPLRISGPVAMWLHYDVMANVLCQVRGVKRLILYPPSEVLDLGLPPGASSSPLNAFEQEIPSSLTGTKAYETSLNPGDVLFIPPLWAHAAAPTGGSSVAVNVFFKNLEQGYSAGKDVYGNRDLQAYENGRKDLQRIRRGFQGLPPEMGKFYLQRLAVELTEIANSFA